MNYAELLTRLASFSKRTDLAAVAPTFVELAESRMNRFLRVKEQEDSISGTIDANNLLAFPTDFAALKHIWPSVYPQVTIQPQTLERVIQRNRTSGTPTCVAITADGLLFDGSGDVRGTYFRKLPALATNSTNWLSETHPDAYLFASLAELHAYAEDATNAAFYDTKAQQVLDSIQRSDMRDRFAGQLVAAVR